MPLAIGVMTCQKRNYQNKIKSRREHTAVGTKPVQAAVRGICRELKLSLPSGPAAPLQVHPRESRNRQETPAHLCHCSTRQDSHTTESAEVPVSRWPAIYMN